MIVTLSQCAWTSKATMHSLLRVQPLYAWAAEGSGTSLHDGDLAHSHTHTLSHSRGTRQAHVGVPPCEHREDGVAHPLEYQHERVHEAQEAA